MQNSLCQINCSTDVKLVASSDIHLLIARMSIAKRQTKVESRRRTLKQKLYIFSIILNISNQFSFIFGDMSGKSWICECSKGFQSKYSLLRHRNTVCDSSLRANDTKKTRRQDNAIEINQLESISGGSNRRPSLRKANEDTYRALPKNNRKENGHSDSVPLLDIVASGMTPFWAVENIKCSNLSIFPDRASSISHSIRQYPSTAIPEGCFSFFLLTKLLSCINFHRFQWFILNAEMLPHKRIHNILSFVWLFKVATNSCSEIQQTIIKFQFQKRLSYRIQIVCFLCSYVSGS